MRNSSFSPNWNPLVDEVSRYSLDHRERLCALLTELEQAFHPLCDPLRPTLGLNRWLSAEREESYSDWLAWIIQQPQLNTDEVLKALGLSNSDFAEHCKATVKCHREFVIPRGRLDILIRFGDDALLVIEVKKTSEEVAQTAKQAGYSEWLKHQARYTASRLLVTEASDEYIDTSNGEFEPLLWEDLCIELRRLLMTSTVRKRLGPVTAALTVAFIGAVEQNLLKLGSPDQQSGSSLLYARTSKHLTQSLPALPVDKMSKLEDKQNDKLLMGGAKSYVDALLAIAEYRRVAQDTCRKAIERSLPKIASSMKIKLAPHEIKTYAWPDKARKAFIGDWAAIGVKTCIGNWEQFYCFAWWDEGSYFGVWVDFKGDPATFNRVVGAIRDSEIDIDVHQTKPELSKWRQLPTETTNGITKMMDAVIDDWCAVWKSIGGLKQFLPCKNP